MNWHIDLANLTLLLTLLYYVTLPLPFRCTHWVMPYSLYIIPTRDTGDANRKPSVFIKLSHFF